MTKRERDLLRKAIRYIHADEDEGGDYDKGMVILCELANEPHIKVPQEIGQASFRELVEQIEPSSFFARWEKVIKDL